MDSPGAIERWKGQEEGLRLYSSYRDAVGIDGGAIEFEWTIFPGFSSLSILQEIQKDVERKDIQPEEFKDRIIFMSMFNDIDWKKNDENCISITEKVKNCTSKFSQGQWTFFGFWVGREVVWKFFLRSKKETGILQPTKWYSGSKKLVILCSKASVA